MRRMAARPSTRCTRACRRAFARRTTRPDGAWRSTGSRRWWKAARNTWLEPNPGKQPRPASIVLTEMSFDVFIQELPPGIRDVREIPDDFVPGPLASRADVLDAIARVAPDAVMSAAGSGGLERDDWSIA